MRSSIARVSQKIRSFARNEFFDLSSCNAGSRGNLAKGDPFEKTVGSIPECMIVVLVSRLFFRRTKEIGGGRQTIDTCPSRLLLSLSGTLGVAFALRVHA